MNAVYLPSNLDLKNLLKEHKPNFKYDIDMFRYIIGTLIMLQVRRKSNEEEDFIPLHSTLLQKRVKKYNHYINYLVEQGVFETDGYYLVGQKSRAYRLTPHYIQTDFVYTKLTSWSLTKRNNTCWAHKRYLNKHYGHLTKWFNKKLQIDYEGALGLLQRLWVREMVKDNKKDRGRSPQELYYLRKISLDKFCRRDFEYDVDDTSKRFHSNLTNMKSELRNFVTYDGKQLCSVDIKNSQPFFSMVLVNPAFYSAEREKLNLFSIAPNIYKLLLPILPSILSLLPTTTISIYTMLVKSDEMQCGSDLELYCTLVDKGRLYQFLSDQYYEKTGFRFDLRIPEGKRALKSGLFWILYSKNKYKSSQKGAAFRDMFRKLFPTVYETFSLIKQKNYKFLPIILQTIESEIILRRVTKSIAKQYPDLPLFTIHDSVVTLADQCQIVHDQLKMECESALGLKPSLQVEKWEP